MPASEAKDWDGEHVSITQKSEILPEKKKYNTVYNDYTSEAEAGTWIVPEGHYFMMGDNRDNSNDSRFFGFIPKENLVGKVSNILFRWDLRDGGDGLQLGRFGTPIN